MQAGPLKRMYLLAALRASLLVNDIKSFQEKGFLYSFLSKKGF